MNTNLEHRNLSLVGRSARLVLALLFAGLAVSGVAATSASATTTPPPNVKACFYYQDGVAVTGTKITLYEASPTATVWSVRSTGTTNSVGCVTWVGVHRGYWYHAMLHKVIGDSNYGMFVYDGYTNVAKTGSTGTLTVKGYVTVRCIPGLYANPC